MADSFLERVADLPREVREEWLASLSEDELEAVLASWTFHARPEQLPPSWAWRWWLLLTGRGFGKTRTGAEWVADRCAAFAKLNAPHLVGLMNKTNDDVRSIQLHGESGLGAVCKRRGYVLDHEGSSLHGAILIPMEDGSWHRSELEVHTGMDPDRCRGRNFNTLWPDELASWKFRVDNLGNTAFTNADLSLRAEAPGLPPQGIITTTPKPITVVRDLLAGEHGPTHVTRGSMMANRANLASSFVLSIHRRYAGTRLGAQEIEGAVLDDVEGALWKASIIEQHRVKRRADVPELAMVVVAVDPSGSDRGDECGIVVVGLARERDHVGRQHVYVLEDASVQNRPAVWGPLVLELFDRHEAHAVVAEVNFGAALVTDSMRVRRPGLPVHEVRASTGKRVRAEPVATLYEPALGQVHHVGYLTELEEQMCTWTPLEPTSPDRMDALVWGVTYLLPGIVTPPAQTDRGFADRRLAA